jgi:hypothetical protein
VNKNCKHALGVIPKGILDAKLRTFSLPRFFQCYMLFSIGYMMDFDKKKNKKVTKHTCFDSPQAAKKKPRHN